MGVEVGLGALFAELGAAGAGEAALGGLAAGEAGFGTAAAALGGLEGAGALGAGLGGLGLGADALAGLGFGTDVLAGLGGAGSAGLAAATPAAGAAGGITSAAGGLPGLTAAAGGLPVDLTAATAAATGIPEGSAGLGAVAGGAGQAATPFALTGPSASGGLSALGGAGGFDFGGAIPGATQVSADLGGTTLPGIVNPEIAGQAAAPGSLSSIEAANPVLETPGFAPSSFAPGQEGLFGSLKGGLNSVVDTLGLNDPGTRALIGAGGLGMQAFQSSGMPPGGQQLQNMANQFSTQGATLTTDALAGKLPPGAQAQLSQASEASKAKVRSEYARMGLSGSTMETQAMAQADQQMAAQGYQMMQQLLNTGLSEQQAAATMMQHLMTAQTAKQTALTGALGRFGGGLGGSTGTTP
jgi:hypothetical protein